MPWRDRHHHAPGLHEDGLVGHALGQEPWEVLSFPATAEADEVHASRRSGDRNASLAFWARPCIRREPLAVLQNIRRTIGEYNFAGQYQQSPAPWAVAWSRPNGSCSAPMNRLLTGRMRTIYSRKEHQAAHWAPPGRPALTGVSGF
jgi:hypothetical protein